MGWVLPPISSEGSGRLDFSFENPPLFLCKGISQSLSGGALNARLIFRNLRMLTPLRGEEAIQKSYFPAGSTWSIKSFSIIKPGNGSTTLGCLFFDVKQLPNEQCHKLAF